MLRVRRLLSLVLAAFVLVGCSYIMPYGGIPEDDGVFYPDVPPEGMALIYFYRSHDDEVPRLFPALLMEDTEILWGLPQGNYWPYAVRPGDVTFRTQTPPGVSGLPLLLAQVEAGDILYVKLARTGCPLCSFTLEQVEYEAIETEMYSLAKLLCSPTASR